jgi:hypothetical protein
VHTDGKMRHVETIPGMGVGKDKGEWYGGASSTMVYCKKFCNCDNVPWVQR